MGLGLSPVNLNILWCLCQIGEKFSLLTSLLASNMKKIVNQYTFFRSFNTRSPFSSLSWTKLITVKLFFINSVCLKNLIFQGLLFVNGKWHFYFATYRFTGWHTRQKDMLFHLEFKGIRKKALAGLSNGISAWRSLSGHETVSFSILRAHPISFCLYIFKLSVEKWNS